MLTSTLQLVLSAVALVALCYLLYRLWRIRKHLDETADRYEELE